MLPWFKDGAFPLFLAPMARFTDEHFRQLCKQQGADVLVSEFVHADSIVRTGIAGRAVFGFSEEQRPMGIQIFGADPSTMAEAAARVEAEAQPDFIDINFGCPAPKVTDQCAGSGLLRDLPRMGAVAAAVAKAAKSIPVTAKIRIGWDEHSIVAAESAKMLEDCGMQAIAIHGRTRVQGYRGEANWELIGQIASERSVPVILNGTINTPQDVAKIRSEYPQVAGVMIGRAAQGYPWIFREIKAFLETGETIPPPDTAERWQTMLEYARLLVSGDDNRYSPENIKLIRPKLQSLTKGMPGSKEFRRILTHLNTLADLEENVQISSTRPTC